MFIQYFTDTINMERLNVVHWQRYFLFANSFHMACYVGKLGYRRIKVILIITLLQSQISGPNKEKGIIDWVFELLSVPFLLITNIRPIFKRYTCGNINMYCVIIYDNDN